METDASWRVLRIRYQVHNTSIFIVPPRRGAGGATGCIIRNLRDSGCDMEAFIY